jgi:hypothetical protein
LTPKPHQQIKRHTFSLRNPRCLENFNQMLGGGRNTLIAIKGCGAILGARTITLATCARNAFTYLAARYKSRRLLQK